MSQLDSVHAPTSHCQKIHLNIILPSTPGSPKRPLFLRSPPNPVYASPLHHKRYVARTSQASVQIANYNLMTPSYSKKRLFVAPEQKTGSKTTALHNTCAVPRHTVTPDASHSDYDTRDTLTRQDYRRTNLLADDSASTGLYRDQVIPYLIVHV